MGSLWPFRRQKLLAVYEKECKVPVENEDWRVFAFVRTALWKWHPLGPPRGFFLIFYFYFVPMVYLRYQHDAWECKFSSLNLHLMFSKLMRQNSGGFLSIKSSTGNKQLMHPCKTHQFFIEMLTFSRVSKHESSPHLSTLWLKYPGQNVSLLYITHGFQQVFCPPPSLADGRPSLLWKHEFEHLLHSRPPLLNLLQHESW